MFRVLQTDGSVIEIKNATSAIIEVDGSLVFRGMDGKVIARFGPLTVSAYGENPLISLIADGDGTEPRPAVL